jgi:hypothetical protein
MIRATPIQFEEIGTSTDDDEMDPNILESLAIDIEDSPIMPEEATHDALDSNK